MSPIMVQCLGFLMDALIEQYRELSRMIALEFAKQGGDHSRLYELDTELSATLDTLVNLQPDTVADRQKLVLFLLSLLTEGRDGGKLQKTITKKIVNLVQ